MMVPGVGVEPTWADGPRDFKAPGKGRRTQDLANSLPFPCPRSPRRVVEFEDYGHPQYGHPSRTPRSASRCLRCDIPPGASFLFGTVFGDPASISFGERAPESSDFKIPAVGRRSWLLSPGVVQVTSVDRVEAEFVDQAKHWGLRL